MAYTVRLTVEVWDVESPTPEEAIAWVKEEIKSAIGAYGGPGPQFWNATAEEA